MEKTYTITVTEDELDKLIFACRGRQYDYAKLSITEHEWEFVYRDLTRAYKNLYHKLEALK